MKIKCPYCQACLPEIPPDGHCSACGRVMHVPTPTTPGDRAARRRRRERIVLDAERRMAAIRKPPDVRSIYSPKVLFAVLVVFTVVGALLVRRAKPPTRPRRELPHQVALRQLDTLATALGRYRFHTDSYPPDSAGLRALLNNPGARGWNGPYVNRLRPDPWRTPYQYRRGTNGIPVLFSSGPDQRSGTPDDLRPDPDAFDPGTDWTNGWVHVIYRQPGALIMRKEWMKRAPAANP